MLWASLGFNSALNRIGPGVAALVNQLNKGSGSIKLVSKFVAQTVPKQTIPEDIWGKWIIRREIPTTISCWGEADAKKLLGTEIEYSTELFRWKDVVTSRPEVETRMISAEKFQADNSGGSVNSSQITFSQLGIHATQAKQISIHHPPATISSATVEIPGDEVLVKNKDTIIFAVCNVYFEAKRAGNKSSAR